MSHIAFQRKIYTYKCAYCASLAARARHDTTRHDARRTKIARRDMNRRCREKRPPKIIVPSERASERKRQEAKGRVGAGRAAERASERTSSGRPPHIAAITTSTSSLLLPSPSKKTIARRLTRAHLHFSNAIALRRAFGNAGQCARRGTHGRSASCIVADAVAAITAGGIVPVTLPPRGS